MTRFSLLLVPLLLTACSVTEENNGSTTLSLDENRIAAGADAIENGAARAAVVAADTIENAPAELEESAADIKERAGRVADKAEVLGEKIENRADRIEDKADRAVVTENEAR